MTTTTTSISSTIQGGGIAWMRHRPVVVLATIFFAVQLAMLLLMHTALYELEDPGQSSPVVSTDWCGDWTRRGNLGNAKYNARYKSPLSETISSCPDSKVGQDYSPDPERLYCHPPVTAFHRSKSILVLDLQRLSWLISQQQEQQQPEYTIVSPSHNVAAVLRQTVPTICNTTVGVWEIVFVLDGSYDDSLQVLREVLLSPICKDSNMVRARVLMNPTAVWETSCDNLGFTLTHPSHFYVEVQSDMILLQYGWNRDMARPFLEYRDVATISGRCGHTQKGWSPTFQVGRCGPEVEHPIPGMMDASRDVFYVTGTNNRGPLMFRADVLQQLGFLDEVNFRQGDDEHDFNRRVNFYGLFAGYKYTDFYEPLNLSPGRNSSFRARVPREALVYDEAYKQFRASLANDTCDPITPQTRKVSPIAPRHSLLRRLPSLPANFDWNSPLPDLPGLINATAKMVF